LNFLNDEATRFLVANDLRFAFQTHGDPADESIILIRGLGTQMVEWSPVLVDALVEGGLQVVIFDNRDVGLSQKLTADYALSDMADDVVEIMSALDVARFHVFGISLGGMVAQLVAVQHGERVRTLISVMSSSGNPALPAASREVRERLMLSAQDREGRIDLETENRAIWGSPGFPESVDVRRSMSILTHDRCHYPEGVSRQMLAATEDGSRIERLRALRVPTLVIHGAEDPLLLPACGEDTAASIPEAEYQAVVGMGHNIPDDLAPAIAARTLTFIAAS
jgi:proline iminopeptidase